MVKNAKRFYGIQPECILNRRFEIIQNKNGMSKDDIPFLLVNTLLT